VAWLCVAYPGSSRAEPPAAATVDAAPAGNPPASPGTDGRAAPPPATPIQSAVAALAAWGAARGAHATAAVMDVPTGTLLASESEHLLVNPASNTKVLTAAVVLDRMGPDYRFTTGLYGKLAGDAVPVLVLRGNGDPSLETDELWELGAALRQLGVRRVDSLLVDQSQFDDAFVPPAFADQPNEWAPFRAPVSAVALERNAVTLNVLPTSSGQPAAAWFDPPGFVDVRGTVETRAPAAGDGVRLTVSPNGTRLLAELGGFIGRNAPRARYSKRVDDPRLFAGYVLAEVLREMGIEVRGVPALGGSAERSRITHVESAPLAVLVRELGKNSDNFYAETLLKALGGFVHGSPAHTQDGAESVLAWLKDQGALEPGTRLTNGSGLFDANRVSAFSLATTLRRAYLSPRIGPDFVAQLAVGGVDGTLRSRFKSHAAERLVRAKTGTLDQVVALSGYVLPTAGRQAVAFSFVVEGVAGRHAEARDRIDRCVEAIIATPSR
jgi:serine-type D-Ala-D-Ala carboxypeptidase/endopeptidase (penicillin-binding protein 4)